MMQQRPSSRPFSTAKLAVTMFLAATLAGCGAKQTAVPTRAGVNAPAATAQTHGLKVTLPDGWNAAKSSLTPYLSEPREVFAAGTFPLRYRETKCAQLPGSALQDLGPADAFVTVQELGAAAGPDIPPPDFPLRPTHFGPRLGRPSVAAQCAPKARFAGRLFRFADLGRYFYALVAFGPRVPAKTRRQAWAILDDLRVDPKRTPGRTSASG